MGPQCFVKEDPNLLICGIHNVPVVQGSIPIDSNAPDLGRITCYICPVSKKVLSDPATRK
jgi:hypothetical protein